MMHSGGVADLGHVGALPYLCGKNGELFWYYQWSLGKYVI